MKQRITYANVMSTIAMFAALTTGGAYAAVTLKANSVTSRHIRNGQVVLADLHPTLRKKLAGTTSKPPVGTAPVAWTDRGLLSPGAVLAECTQAAGCSTDQTTNAITGLDVSAPTLPSGGQPGGKGVKFRLTGTITNEGTGVIRRPHLSIYFGKTSAVAIDANYRYLQCMLDDQTGGGIQPGQTLTIEAKWCPDFTRTVADRYMRLQVVAHSASGPALLRSNLKLEYSAG